MNFSALHEKLNQYINKGRLKSPWVVHYDCGSCNGCDIEVLACLTPVFDVERFGIVNIGDPKHADVLLVTGTVNQRNKDVLKNLYDQMPEPKWVIAMGNCAISGGPFVYKGQYGVVEGVDKLFPVDVFVPGCPPRPEALIEGILKLEEKLTGTRRWPRVDPIPLPGPAAARAKAEAREVSEPQVQPAPDAPSGNDTPVESPTQATPPSEVKS